MVACEQEPAQHIDAWQKAVVAYRDWLRPHLPAPIQPKAMLQSEGLAAVCLECISVFNLTMLQTRFEPWRELGYRLQLWGQMSNSANAGAVPPLKPGEAHGCCLMEYKMHPRYADAGLPQWVKSLGAQGVEAGYYSQPLRPMVDNPDRNVSWGGMPINNTAWIVGWLDVLRNNYSANGERPGSTPLRQFVNGLTQTVCSQRSTSTCSAECSKAPQPSYSRSSTALPAASCPRIPSPKAG